MYKKLLLTSVTTLFMAATTHAQSLTTEDSDFGDKNCLSQRSTTTCVQMRYMPNQSNLVDRILTYNRRGRLIGQSRGRKDLVKKLQDRSTLRLYNKINAEAAKSDS